MQLSNHIIALAAALFCAATVSADCNFYDGGCPANTCFLRGTDTQVVCCDNGDPEC
ncbi:hypothetical protein CGMCC3_g7288 [Colletotrichum fructicola]|nr:uncharacterized protein CGMCC3_g7288 [Colletotrichum fructicola]KAE9576695.1 hypothetical protein CGMCC3_g7288 [Colletotrichum fructicola]